MESLSASQAKPRLNRWFLLAIPLILGVVAILFYFNPAQNGFYPRCILKATTGLDCPGCGALRASHQLLHGNIGAAFSLNPLLILLAPVAGLLLLNQAVGRMRGRPLFHIKLPGYLIWILLVVVIAFTILRNLPSAPLS